MTTNYMKFFLSIGFSIVVALVLNGCQKNSPSTGSGNTSVYVAGFDNGDIVYWKDGKENKLATAAPGYYGNASGIAVVSGDMYVSGYVGDTAVYWKNGKEIYLSNPDSGTALTTAMTTMGSDIYIAGYGHSNIGNYAAYWKNGARTIVCSNSNLITAASIAVSGNDIYFAATIGNDTAVFWKNGTRTTLGSHYSNAYGIAVSGTDVYVTGVDNGVPVYWKNGTETALPYTALSGTDGITISGTDVYISGVDNGNAVYWKNGIEKILDVGAANAIAVSNSDIYVTGFKFSSQTNYATYWKNGSLVSFVGSQPGTMAREEGTAVAVVTY
jgi:hypothetical protein